MNPLRKIILDELVKPQIASTTQIYIATVLEYNHSNNSVNVKVATTENVGEVYNNVPINTTSSYVYGKNPRFGSSVILGFVNNDRTHPYIISVLNEGEISNKTGNSIVIPQYSASPLPIDNPVRPMFSSPEISAAYPISSNLVRGDH